MSCWSLHTQSGTSLTPALTLWWNYKILVAPFDVVTLVTSTHTNYGATLTHDFVQADTQVTNLFLSHELFYFPFCLFHNVFLFMPHQALPLAIGGYLALWPRLILSYSCIVCMHVSSSYDILHECSICMVGWETAVGVNNHNCSWVHKQFKLSIIMNFAGQLCLHDHE